MSETFVGNKICRCCLRRCENPFNLFETHSNTIQLARCLDEICGIQISIEDNLPESICISCHEILKQSYKFRLQVQKNNSFLINILKVDDMIEEEDNVIQDNQCNIRNHNDEVENAKESNYIEMDPVTETKEAVYLISNNECKEMPKTFECCKCGKIFKYLKNMKQHQKQHNTEPTMKCPTCTKCFYRYYDLKRHIQIYHLKERPFLCSICEKNFHTKSELNRHERFHTSKKNFKCSNCDQEFYENSSLKFHIKTVHLKERLYNCNVCHKKFATNSKVKRHQNSKSCGKLKMVSTVHHSEELLILDFDQPTKISNDKTIENDPVDEFLN